jgi:dTDP-4-amino-4,6-dideoxygalactose transaminase
VVAEFEKKFAAYTGLEQVVAVNSCTAALHLALLALGVGPGDEVITTPMTFISSANAIVYTGGKVVLADVEPDTGLLDVERVAEKITARTRAIMPVHLYGAMADMKGLRALADKHGLSLVEDCAHCVEGERDGVRPGQLGDLACFSFYATKNLTSGEGGAVASANPLYAQKVRQLRQHGMSKEAATRYSGLYQHWDMEVLGWKYNFNDILAALMLPQLDRLDAQFQRRQQIAQRYDQALSALPNLRLPLRPGTSALHLYTVWVDEDKRDAILHDLQRQGVGVAVNYRAIHNLTYYKKLLNCRADDYPHANRIGNSTISLPFYLSLSAAEQEYVLEVLEGALLTL